MSLQENDKGLGEKETKNTPAVYCCYIRNKLEEVPDKVSLSRFNDIFNCLWKNPKKTSENVFRVLKNLMKNGLLEEIEALNKDFGIEEKLKTRDLLCAEYADKKDAIQWRPDGNVEATLVSHDMEEKLKRKHLLESVVNKKMKEVERLKSQLEKNTSQLRKSEHAIDEAIEEYKHKYSSEMKYFNFLRLMIKGDNLDSVTPSSFFDLKYIRSPCPAIQHSQLLSKDEEKFRRKCQKESVISQNKLEVHKNI